MRKVRPGTYLVNASMVNDLDKNERFVARRCGIYLERLLSRYPLIDDESMTLLYWILGPQQMEKIALYLINQGRGREKELFKEELSESRHDPAEYPWTIVRILKKVSRSCHSQLLRLIVETLRQRVVDLRYRGLSDIERNMACIQKMFNLSNQEVEYCLFQFIIAEWNAAGDFFESHLECNKFARRHHLAVMLAMNSQDLNALYSGTLVQMGMIESNRFATNINRDYLDLFRNPSSRAISQNLFTELSRRELAQKGLPLDHHLIEHEQTEHALALLREKPSSSTHILLYGQPGTGKSTYAYGIAQKLGLPVYEILRGDETSESFRRRAAIMACLNLTNISRHPDHGSLIFVDDADSILNTQHFWSDRSQPQDKAWLNQLLEIPGVRMIWITNQVSGIEESVIRRFAFSLPFRPFGRRQRICLWDSILRRHKVKRLVSRSEIKALAGQYKVSVGVIDLAVKKATEAGEKKGFHKAVSLALDSYCTLRNHGEKPQGKDRIEECYSLEGLNIQGDIQSIIDQLEAFDRYLRQPKHAGPGLNMNLLFYGPPGCGKSELARSIACQLDREIMVKAASDLLDRYVGGTESNIKQAFREAEAEDSVLLIDEADSLLFSRDRAAYSWEVSHTNEFLAQMERFAGILICTTNRLPDLDAATIRRFNHKVEFKSLTPEGNRIFYQKILASFVTSPPDLKNLDALSTIADLTPGDFKVVRDRFSFRPGQEITHEGLVAALREESRMKRVHRGDKREAGF